MSPSGNNQAGRIRERTLLTRFRPLLRLAATGLRLLPRSWCCLLLSILRFVPTMLGIALRYPVVARLAKSCGDNVVVFEGAYLFELQGMTIGDNVAIHEMCYSSAAGGISIGSNVGIGHGTTIISTEHNYMNRSVLMWEAGCLPAPVAIGNDVWIGAGARILAGVTLGEHVVIAAGAVVARDVPAGSVAAGVPAKIIRKI